MPRRLALIPSWSKRLEMADSLRPRREKNTMRCFVESLFLKTGTRLELEGCTCTTWRLWEYFIESCCASQHSASVLRNDVRVYADTVALWSNVRVHACSIGCYTVRLLCKMYVQCILSMHECYRGLQIGRWSAANYSSHFSTVNSVARDVFPGQVKAFSCDVGGRERQ